MSRHVRAAPGIVATEGQNHRSQEKLKNQIQCPLMIGNKDRKDRINQNRRAFPCWRCPQSHSCHQTRRQQTGCSLISGIGLDAALSLAHGAPGVPARRRQGDERREPWLERSKWNCLFANNVLFDMKNSKEPIKKTRTNKLVQQGCRMQDEGTKTTCICYTLANNYLKVKAKSTKYVTASKSNIYE